VTTWFFGCGPIPISISQPAEKFAAVGPRDPGATRDLGKGSFGIA